MAPEAHKVFLIVEKLYIYLEKLLQLQKDSYKWLTAWWFISRYGIVEGPSVCPIPKK